MLWLLVDLAYFLANMTNPILAGLPQHFSTQNTNNGGGDDDGGDNDDDGDGGGDGDDDGV